MEMQSLETLILSNCSSLKRFLEVSPCMVKLSKIYLDHCNRIKDLPSSLRYLSGLMIGLKVILMLFGVTTAHIGVTAAQLKLMLLMKFNEEYAKCLPLLKKVTTASEVKIADYEDCSETK
ncbi:TMV resistance protein N-like protein [Tanacetum coccineum]